MKERNLWKMAVVVFVFSLAVVLAGGGLVANAGDYRTSHHGDWDKGNLFITADTVRGGTNVPGPSICTQSNRYLRLQTIVFRIKVFDEDNNPLDDTELKKVFVRLQDGTGLEIDARYGGHPHGVVPPDDNFWTAAWLIPADHVGGSLSYEVVAIANNHSVGTYQPYNINSSMLFIDGSPPPPD